MLKVAFESVKFERPVEVEVYNTISRIPFCVSIEQTRFSGSIYSRNLNGESFIEFSFDKDSKKLYKICLISFQAETIENANLDELDLEINGFYDCLLQDESEIEISEPFRILRDNKSICIMWGINNLKSVKYYSLSNKCYLGIDPDSRLVSVVLKNLLQEEIFEIFGF